MLLIKDFSLHFTIKGQTVEQISQKLLEYFAKNNIIFESEKTVLHHCFLSRKAVTDLGFSTGVVDFLDSLCGYKNQVCWYGSKERDLALCRFQMLRNLKQLNGKAWFVGDIIEGVKDEYELANILGVECVLVP